MKKIISSIIIVVLLMGLCTTNTFASQDALTKKDAISLVEDAYRMMTLCQGGEMPVSVKGYSEHGSIWSQFNDPIVLFKDSLGETYLKGIRYGKAVVTDISEDYSTLPKINTAVRKVFTEEMARRMLKVKYDFTENDTYFVFYCDSYWENENSELFISEATAYGNLWGYFLMEYNSFNCAENTAKMVVTVREYKPPLIPDIYSKETVEFTKTADGWRVSGGTAFEVMLGDREPNFNPSTGDASSYTVPALTVAAIISVALPVTLLRKRRRVV